MSLATHKFVADLTNDAMQHCKERHRQAQAKSPGKPRGEAKLVLTTDDLAATSREHGIHIRKPPYYADHPAGGSSSGGAMPMDGGGGAV